MLDPVSRMPIFAPPVDDNRAIRKGNTVLKVARFYPILATVLK